VSIIPRLAHREDAADFRMEIIEEPADYQFTVVIEPDEQGFHAYVPSLPGCHTFGDTIDEVRANIAEAIELHIEAMSEPKSE